MQFDFLSPVSVVLLYCLDDGKLRPLLLQNGEQCELSGFLNSSLLQMLEDVIQADPCALDEIEATIPKWEQELQVRFDKAVLWYVQKAMTYVSPREEVRA